MPTRTYEPILTYTLPGDTTAQTLSGIPNTYTDLIITVSTAAQTGSSNGLRYYFNGQNTGGTYDVTHGYGRVSGAFGARETNLDINSSAWQSAPGVTLGSSFYQFHIMNYTSAWYKPTITNVYQSETTQDVELSVSNWRNTAVINSVTFQTSAGSGNQLKAGTVFTIIGIKAG
jgi:hypothetical protein